MHISEIICSWWPDFSFQIFEVFFTNFQNQFVPNWVHIPALWLKIQVFLVNLHICPCYCLKLRTLILNYDLLAILFWSHFWFKISFITSWIIQILSIEMNKCLCCLLKVSKSRKQNTKFSHTPKNHIFLP